MMHGFDRRPSPPRPRPYNPTTMSVRKRPSLHDVELVSLDDPDVFFEEISEVRPRIVIDDDVVLPPMTEWQDMNLPLPPPRPRRRSS
ncbi:MAG: hypothetical protein KIT84_30450 [Labilithrix sp.]|nr:hypothetical protein [Labilithrix sp.]MCW5815387.1 hypothetical protein [Labilithrix sp.]